MKTKCFDPLAAPLRATYWYDGLGRLVSTQDLAGSIDYYYNEQYQMLEVRLGPGGAATETYVWDERYIDAPVMSELTDRYTPGVQRFYYMQDANFNVTAAIGENGEISGRAVYTPYGQRTVLSSDWQLESGAYIGQLGHQGLMLLPDTSNSGMYYNRARFYHPTLGRFVQRDPLGYVDGGSLYEYLRGIRGRDERYVRPRSLTAGRSRSTSSVRQVETC